MLETIQEVHDGFFKKFQPTVTLLLGATPLAVPVVYARHSDKEYVKKKMESYPVIVLLDNGVTPSDTWRPNDQLYVAGLELNTAGDAFDKGWVTKDPVELNFSYQVSGYFSNLAHKIAFQQWLFENFRAFGGMLLHPVEVVDNSGEFIGDMVTYKMATNESERTDGIFEVVCTFTLMPLVHLEKAELIDLVQTFTINSNPTNL